MSDLIAMTKNGETLGVHPTCVEDHQRNGWVVGGELPGPESAVPGSGDDIAALRAEYEAKLGKKPFMGWDAETLNAKITEAAGE